MNTSPQKFREAVLQLLYSRQNPLADPLPTVALLAQQLSLEEQQILSALAKTERVLSRREDIDALIVQFSTSYEFERIQRVTLAILRLGAFELLFEQDLAPEIVIAEAVRLSRKFSSPESAAFVNAVLDKILKNSQPR